VTFSTRRFAVTRSVSVVASPTDAGPDALVVTSKCDRRTASLWTTPPFSRT
jgi:hypothetical protein